MFKRAIRRAGMKVANNKVEAVVNANTQGVFREFEEQQKKIDSVYRLQKETCTAIDTSYSQVRNAKF